MDRHLDISAHSITVHQLILENLISQLLAISLHSLCRVANRAGVGVTIIHNSVGLQPNNWFVTTATVLQQNTEI